MKTLLLRLSAPLQSWGSSSYYDTRDTDEIPTKSGIIGFLSAALGRKRNESVDDLNSLFFGVRVDHPGERIMDYHTTDMGDKLNTNISQRYYLSDAMFLVGLATDDISFLEEIYHAVSCPCYSLFLGRRSCPPTQPVNLGIRDFGLEDALRAEPWLMTDERRIRKEFGLNRKIRLRIVMDAVQNDDCFSRAAVKKDLPVSFSPYRREYRYRYVRETSVEILRNLPEYVDDEHDPMRELGG